MKVQMFPQPAILLEDIRNYYSTLHIMSDIYYERYIVKPGAYKHEDRIRLADDIKLFINYDNASHAIFLIHILSRHICITNSFQAISYATRLDGTNYEHELRVYWGLMKPSERLMMISMYCY